MHTHIHNLLHDLEIRTFRMCYIINHESPHYLFGRNSGKRQMKAKGKTLPILDDIKT